MMFSINGWVEAEYIDTFITLTDNWTLRVFGTHLCRNNTIILTFWDKDNIVKKLLNKSHCNIDVFGSRCNYFSLNNRDTTFFVLAMYCSGPSLEF